MTQQNISSRRYFLRVQLFLLACAGFRFRTNEGFLFKVYAIINTFLLTVIQIPETVFVVNHLLNVPEMTEGLCTLFTVQITVTKLFCLLFNKKSFYNLVADLKDLWQPDNNNEKTILVSASKKDNTLSIYYFISAVVTALFYVLMPITKIKIEELHMGNTTWRLPMKAEFIFDVFQSPAYALVYTWFSIGTFYTMFACIAIDVLWYGCCLNLSAHLKIIQNRFEYIQANALQSKRKISMELLDLIKYHRRILEFCTELNRLYKPIIAFQFLTTSVLICAIAFQMIMYPVPYIIANHVFYLAAIIFQIFVYCHGGTQIEHESAKVADSIYFSRWYDGTLVSQHFIQFALMRAQKSYQVKAGFFSANLSTLTSIISTAGSYITLLKSMNEPTA